MKKKTLLIQLLLLLSYYSFASNEILSPADSVTATTCHHHEKKTRVFIYTQLISPSLLIGSGALALCSQRIRSVDNQINRGVSAQHKRVSYDDYIQYVPTASVLLLEVCGVKSENGFKKQVITLPLSILLTATLVNAGKYSVQRMRPDQSSKNSFPSGHTATAFMGAELLRMEYGKEYPLIAATGYALAAMTGAMRIYNNKHFLSDVLAGAGVGILSVRIAYWLSPYLNDMLWKNNMSRSGGVPSLSPYLIKDGYGVTLSFNF